EERALKEARGLFQLIETRCRDSIGYLEAFDEGFTPVENDKLSENGVIAEKTMNTLLHVFEAYTQLYRITGDLAVRSSLCRILDSFATQIYNPLLRRQEVFFDRNLHSLLDLHSYGHDIETAWLIDWGVEVLGEESYRNKMEPITRALAKEVYQRAYQKHSLSNECENGVVDTSRVWWVQAEAVVGFYNAYEKTGEIKYQEAAREIWGFIKEYIIDGREGSEWYWKVDENGIPNREKPMVEPWKCPYHNGRMCFEIIRRSNNAASKVL
ncbi:MAG: cellobiose epimerase, partial [Clostridiales bacterium]|nr:cellobiose epimerase [Clostridiales bacterium]